MSHRISKPLFVDESIGQLRPQRKLMHNQRSPHQSNSGGNIMDMRTSVETINQSQH